MMSPVMLSLPNSVERFHRFIFADAAARAPFIYGLDLAFLLPDLNDEICLRRFGDCLVAILEAAIHIEHLRLSTAIGDPVFAAAAKVTSLRELIVRPDDSDLSREALHRFLITLRSPLRYLCIDNYGEIGLSASFFHNDLAHFAPTLQILELDNFDLDISPSGVRTPFSAIRSLIIRSSCYFQSQLSTPAEVFLRLFPNLDDTLKIALGALDIDSLQLEGVSRGLQERSMEVQKAFTWSRLDHIICDAQSAFWMALQCPIRRMDIVHMWLPPGPRQCLIETLRYSCPQQLHLSFDARTFTLHELFPSETADKLTHLVMFVMVDVKRPNPQAGPIDSLWLHFIVRHYVPHACSVRLILF